MKFYSEYSVYNNISMSEDEYELLLQEVTELADKYYFITSLNIENIEKISENSFKVNINREEIPEFINKLIDKKIKIYSIYEDKLSLEDAFLKRTGGNQID